jgi:hypothetical protein
MTEQQPVLTDVFLMNFTNIGSLLSSYKLIYSSDTHKEFCHHAQHFPHWGFAPFPP